MMWLHVVGEDTVKAPSVLATRSFWWHLLFDKLQGLLASCGAHLGQLVNLGPEAIMSSTRKAHACKS